MKHLFQMANDRIYTASQAAELLGLKVETVWKYLKGEGLRGYKKAGRWYLLHSDLVAWLRS